MYIYIDSSCSYSIASIKFDAARFHIIYQITVYNMVYSKKANFPIDHLFKYINLCHKIFMHNIFFF